MGVAECLREDLLVFPTLSGNDVIRKLNLRDCTSLAHLFALDIGAFSCLLYLLCTNFSTVTTL